MSRWAIAAVAMAIASPAAAQDIVFTEEATRSCLGTAPDSVAQEACIGKSSNACMAATSGGGTTYGMGACLDQELSYWDGLLNTYYQAALQRAKTLDADTRKYAPEAANMEKSLREMQRAWIPFRDASCDFERAQWTNGTGAGPATLSCLMEMTGKQALKLGRFGYGS